MEQFKSLSKKNAQLNSKVVFMHYALTSVEKIHVRGKPCFFVFLKYHTVGNMHICIHMATSVLLCP